MLLYQTKLCNINLMFYIKLCRLSLHIHLLKLKHNVRTQEAMLHVYVHCIFSHVLDKFHTPGKQSKQCLNDILVEILTNTWHFLLSLPLSGY